MAGSRSAGLLLYRVDPDGVRVLLAHMGGPYWAGEDHRAWTIPKGEPGPDEDDLTAAHREFAEELGSPAPADAVHLELGSVRQSGGKVVIAWAVAGDFDVTTVQSNTFELVWPPRSGRIQLFPEIDRAAWFDVATARAKIVKGQVSLLDRLERVLGAVDSG